MELQDIGVTGKFLIHDRAAEVPAPFDEILADAAIRTVFTAVRTLWVPRAPSAQVAAGEVSVVGSVITAAAA
ncbi:hypothetical protein ACPA54_34715 [Uniformispora flossi]|uniref:hypothetical protein n=1 Tax=Uniformispora flossi TaxID=3390723 RepID=UPI003C30E96C